MYLVTDEISGFNKHRKVAFVSTFDFPALCTKLLYNKLLMTLNSLIDFCFNLGESKYITVNSYGAHWIKNIKGNAIYHKQQIKDAVVYLFSNCYFTIGPKIFFCQVIGVPVGSDTAPLFAIFFLYFYESK